MRVEGYRLNSYDATYEKALFDVIKHKHSGECVLEVTELLSGITFIFSEGSKNDRRTKKKNGKTDARGNGRLADAQCKRRTKNDRVHERSGTHHKNDV